MKLKKSVLEALNDQIKHELYSSNLYLSMSSYFNGINLPGFAHWMRMQSQEEYAHAMKFLTFIEDMGGRVVVPGIGQPPTDFEGPLQVLEQTLEHEQKVTGLINKLYDLAVKENDHATQVLLQWFITEQIEEEKNATQIFEQMKLVGSQGAAIFMIDRELATRQPDPAE